MKQFLRISLGQLISRIGSGMTHFAIGIWVYQTTGSSTQFALLLFFAMLPGLLAAPLAGVVVDRYDRRNVMIASNVVSLVTTLLAALMILRGSLAVWMVYPLLMLGSVFEAFLSPALAASATSLVSKEDIGRASGLSQLPQAAELVLSPLLAGVFLNAFGMGPVILIDVATFVVAIATLVSVRIPRVDAVVAKEERAFWADVREGFAFIASRSGMFANILFVAVYNYLLGVFQVVLTPLVLSFATATALGTIVSVAGLGMLAGAIGAGATGGPRRRMRGILIFSSLMSLGIALTGVLPSRVLIGLGTALAFLCAPVINGASQAIWQVKVPAALQGRVFSTRRALQSLSAPLAFLSVGPLIDHVFEPLLRPDGALASSVGAVLGTGSGRGMGLLCVVLGGSGFVTTAIAAMTPSIRDVESRLPDAVPSHDAPSPDAEGGSSSSPPPEGTPSEGTPSEGTPSADAAAEGTPPAEPPIARSATNQSASATRGAPIIRLEGLSKTYAMGEVVVNALREVSVDIHEGEMVAIMGASGSGKSTMLNVIGTLDRPTHGRYLLDGEPVEDLEEEDLAALRNQKIGFVFQAFHLLPRETAQANVELPMVYAQVGSSARHTRAARALARVGLADRADHLPTQLSGGQQQRVSIARALVNEPRLLLADEPTGALDSASTKQIMELFRDLHAEGMTIVLVTHDPGVAKYADRLITFRDGSIVSDSTNQPIAEADLTEGAVHA